MKATSPRPFVILYIAFFAIWCGGLILDALLPDEPQIQLFGLPLWFVLSAIVSYLAATLALIWILLGKSRK